MDAIEKAIRNAFEKGNAEDREFREKVYRSAFAALDRALKANPGVTVENAINRRKAMQAKIAEIESEFLPAVPDIGHAAFDTAGTDDVATAAPSVDAPAARGGGDISRRDEPVLSVDDRPRSHATPVVPDIIPDRAEAEALARQPASEGEVEPDRDERRMQRRRFPLGALIAALVVLAVIGGGFWWLKQSGLLRGDEASSSSAQVTEQGEDYTPQQPTALPDPDDASDDREWITVFTPSNPASVSAPADAKVEAMKDDTGSFLRIRSGASGSSVAFDVGQGVLDELAGKHAVFVIVARAQEGQETQMSVSCNFGDLGDCGRKRYTVANTRNEYLFDVTFPGNQPGAAGTISIDPDFDNKGKAVDIYEIRVAVAP
ncbi:hypothetical protein [Manganibacter manganicus]|uniref:Biotin transporter BioY n=1 Tax=Manganibacter manganicus TaxID=1873176 RepID=A0A1V8RKR9_9HYPH|nr:hypothetical protein [Pseudaminobacter manganicus]OQM73683.1 hypothetical protein BFN67_07125 [Pseudaminobacter manganicus]